MTPSAWCLIPCCYLVLTVFLKSPWKYVEGPTKESVLAEGCKHAAKCAVFWTSTESSFIINKKNKTKSVEPILVLI